MKVRLKAKRRNESSLICSINIHPHPFPILEIGMNYKGKASCFSFPCPGSDIMDEDVFTTFTLPSALKTFMKLKEVTEA